MPLIDRVIRTAVSALVDTYHTNANQRDGEQPKNYPFREPITWATIVLALATVASVGVAALQWDTLDKTDETLKTNERAFVFVSQFQAFIVKDTQRIFPVWENSGSTPATDAAMWSNWKIFPEQPPVTYAYPDMDTNGNEIIDNVGYNSTIGPHVTQAGVALAIPIQAMRAVRAGQGRLFVWGWVEYRDVFEPSHIHRTEFCNEVVVEAIGLPDNEGRITTTLTFQVYGPHNSIR